MFLSSHRALAMFRGRNEGFLQLRLNADPDQEEGVRHSYCEEIIREHLGIHLAQQPADKCGVFIPWTWRIKIFTS